MGMTTSRVSGKSSREIFRPHSHDAADSIDDALEASERGVHAVKVSFLALIMTTLVQLAVVVITDSVELLADTVHNFSDTLTAVPLFLAFRLSRRPSTRRYTYGYHRAEDLAGVFVILMITVSAVIAAWEATLRLFHPEPVSHLGVLFVAGIVGFVGNELVALYRIHEGNAIGSAAARGGRLPRPHRRLHVSGCRPRRDRRVGGLGASRCHRRSRHIDRDLRGAARRCPAGLLPPHGRGRSSDRRSRRVRRGHIARVACGRVPRRFVGLGTGSWPTSTSPCPQRFR